VGCVVNVSEEHTASIIRAEVRSVVYIDALMMEAIYSSETVLGQSMLKRK
jgi:hypothetical protein